MSLRKSRLAIVLRPLKLCEFLSKSGHLVKLVCDVTAGGFKITYGGLATALRNGAIFFQNSDHMRAIQQLQ